MARYEFQKRNIIAENSRFYICFDEIKFPGSPGIDNFLTIKPKICHTNQIVGVCILPFVNNKFLLMKGWRHQFDTEIWQAPAGFVEPGESSIESAHRELVEETGLVCKSQDIIQLGSYIPDAGLIEGKIGLYLALHCTPITDHLEPEFGTGNLHSFNPLALNELLMNSCNIGGSTCIASFRALNYLNTQI